MNTLAINEPQLLVLAEEDKEKAELPIGILLMKCLILS